LIHFNDKYVYDQHCIRTFCFDIHRPRWYPRSPDPNQPWPGLALRRTTRTHQEAKQRALPPRSVLYHAMQDLHSWVLLPRRPEPQSLWCRCIFRNRCDSVHSLSKRNILQQYVPPLSLYALANSAIEQTTKYVTGCETVAPGHRANNSIGATSQIACGKGSYSMGATDTCTTCPAGSKCTSSRTSEPAECDPGTYSNAGNSGSCTNCPKGTFSSVCILSCLDELSEE
jgi:hypothetical protein